MPETPALPLGVIAGAGWAILTGGKRALRRDALICTSRLPLCVLGEENIPQSGPGVIVLNHYYRPGFTAEWIGLSVSAVIPQDLVWIMSAAWTEANTTWTRIKAAGSGYLFPRLARVYNIISMPPMPPRAYEVTARAMAVRQILKRAQELPPPLLAITPEGQDSPGGDLMQPPAGVGRLLNKLDQYGLRFYPVGFYESSDHVVMNFGPGFSLALPKGLSNGEIDRQAADQAMQAIARQLPSGLRGEYS